MIVQKVNRRLGNRKTTTGCITCKIRRIKCGEERPSCRRCTSTGRKCDGYKDEFATDRSACSVTPPTLPSPNASLELVSLNLDAGEAHALRFFTSQAASDIAGWTHVDFWTRTVPQLSQSHRAVQHAATAIGSLLLRFRNPVSNENDVKLDQLVHNPASRAFALDQYGKAIKATLTTIEARRGDVGLAAVTCLLFVCIEALQGHESEAISVFHRGQIALQGWQSENKARAPLSADIHPVFASLGLQFMLFDHNFNDEAVIYEAGFCSPEPSPFPPMASLTEAYRELLNILAFIQTIIAVATEIKWRRTTAAEEERFAAIVQRQAAGDRLLQAWYSRFQDLTQHQHNDTKLYLQQRIGTSILLQQYHILRIWLAGSVETAERFNDMFLPQFKTIVAEATYLAKFTSCTASKTDFCLEMGTIPPLYWTVLKCRDPVLRRRALSLLINGPRQEGLWDSRIVSKVGWRVVQLEEGLGVDEGIPGDAKWEGDAGWLPSEEKRVKSIRIQLRTVLDGEHGDLVEFRTLPDGFAGEWNVWKEFIAL